jgi:uncharacterized membrane protein
MKTYLIAFVVFIVIDAIWLGVVAKNIYKNEIGHLMSDKPNFIAAAVFYLIFIFGLVYFVINPALDANSFFKAVLSGLLFGFITYSTYDLTNLATLKDWPIKITIIDLIWGSTLGACVSSVTFLVSRRL